VISQLQSRLEDNRSLRVLALGLLAIGVGAVGGFVLVAMGNPILPIVLVAGLVALPWLVTRPMADLLLVALTATLLPFAASPVRLAVLTPTLLEVGLLLLYTSWLLKLLTGSGLRRTPLDVWLVLFVAATLFAFVLGLGRDPSTDVMHNYFKLVLAMGVFFAVVNIACDWRAVATVLNALIVSGAVQAMLGIALWALPDSRAAGLLTRLSAIGYPTGRVIRYVEDNPALGERATGTQVDPNSFGGMLVVVATLTGVQLLARRPLLPRWLLSVMFAAQVGALVLTQSRAALLGLVAAGALVGTLRYRRLWVWGAVGAVLIMALGIGGGYFARLQAGLRFEDPANQMRLAEYRNAMEIIARYPVFGVGFGTAGELGLTTGVSSIYLTIAERAGLVALALFMASIGVFLVSALTAIRASHRPAPGNTQSKAHSPYQSGNAPTLPPAQGSQTGADDALDADRRWSVLDSAVLGGTAAVFGALVVGVADHYFFNIEFPHMVALFWLSAGLAMSARHLLMRADLS
jgi:hypothetical protein